MAAVPSIGRASAVEARPAAPEAELTRALYERHSRQIFNYCLHQLGNREEAEDATQTTFLNAFRGLQRGVVPELESAWLFKIANNVILTRRRSSFRRRRVETPGDLDALQDVLPSPQRNADELIRLTDALAGMPEQQRRALLLREWQGLSYHEIGEELGLSQSAVETLLFRARRSLAEGLTDPDRSSKRSRLRSGLDLGSLFGLLKGLLSGGAAVKAVAAAAVVASSAAVVATDPVVRHRVHESPAPVAKTVPAPSESRGRLPAASRMLEPSAEELHATSVHRAAVAPRRVVPVESVPAAATPEASTPEVAPPQTGSPPETAPQTESPPAVPAPTPTPVVETRTPVEDTHPTPPATIEKTERKGAASPVAAKGPDKGDSRADRSQGRGVVEGRGKGGEPEGDPKVTGQAAPKKQTLEPVAIPVVPAPQGLPSSDGAAPGNAAPGNGALKKQDTPQPPPAAAPTIPDAATAVPVVAAPADLAKGSDGSKQQDRDAGNRDGRGNGRK